MSRALLSAACHAYGVAGVLYLLHLIRPRGKLALAGAISLWIGFGLHGAEVAVRFAEVGQPAVGLSEGLSLFAWLLVGGYLALDLRYRLPVIGSFVTPLVLAGVVPALLIGGKDRPLPAALDKAGLTAHITIAFLGIAAFVLAAGVAGMYLLMEREVKGKRIGPWFSRLPSLDVLDQINFQLVRWGFVALSVTIASGAIFAKQAWGGYWQWDPKQSLSLLGWAIFASIIYARLITGWRGRRVAFLTMVGAAVLMLSFIGLMVFPVGHHAGTFQ